MIPHPPGCTIFEEALPPGDTLLCRPAILIVISIAIWQASLFAQQQNSSPGDSQPPTKTDEIDILNVATEPSSIPIRQLPEIKIPNFSTCSLRELQKAIPELAHLKTSDDQSHLVAILDKIGAKTVEIARKTPDLVSDELVVSDRAGFTTHHRFSYLLLRHMSGSTAVLDEFRVDAETGVQFQTNAIEKAAQANAPTSNATSSTLPTGMSQLRSQQAPASQGFASQWLNFYPPNRPMAVFRYLGEEKMDGHRTLVVAFAQKPGFVPLPTTFHYEGKVYQVFLQGVVWVDAVDYRIVRLRSDILSPPPGVPLNHLGADIEFAEVVVKEIASPLWLPRRVVVTSSLRGPTVRETHTYSNYRLFRTKSKVLLNP